MAEGTSADREVTQEVPWLSRRWLVGAVVATTTYLLIVIAVDLAGIDTNIDTGNNAAKGVLLVALAFAAATWCGLLLHAVRVLGTRSSATSRLTSDASRHAVEASHP